ncbi:MAG: glycosyltransferase [Thermoanaerobaculia bacterium]
MALDLFVGVTTWNSELFLPHCLQSIRRTTGGLKMQIGVADNRSTDRSVEIARDFGAKVHIEYCRQSIALNRLLSMSNARVTLLLHSDVILVSPRWFAVCDAHLRGRVALVSPEDIGCGPLTRPYGAGMPESCFLLFDTRKAKEMRQWVWIRRKKIIPWLERKLDLDHYYVTHDLPDTLARHGYTWQPMRVHPSPREPKPVWRPSFTPEYWSEKLEDLRYAMGNFYSLDGEITHYHNWFDRVPKDVPVDSRETTDGNGKGLPLAFLSLGTRTFLNDVARNDLRLPSLGDPDPVPMETPRHVPDLQRPYVPQP